MSLAFGPGTKGPHIFCPLKNVLDMKRPIENVLLKMSSEKCPLKKYFSSTKNILSTNLLCLCGYDVLNIDGGA
jgi:hypothetical protein